MARPQPILKRTNFKLYKFVRDEQSASILFRFAQPNRKHFYYKQKRQETQQLVEGAASNDRVFLQKSEPGHTEYKLQAKEYK